MTMLSPEEKAKELFGKFYHNSYVPWMSGKDEFTQEEAATDSAIICVDEIINVLLTYKAFPDGPDLYSVKITYWQQVKEYLTKM